MTEHHARSQDFSTPFRVDPPVVRSSHLNSVGAKKAHSPAEGDALSPARASAEDLLDEGPLDPDQTLEVSVGLEPPGMEIGPYKIREVLGKGGMGIVYVAEQMEPIHRKVALKIIKPGMDSREVLARFDAERQALELMSHPHIAKVLDGGTTEAGRPYFVMELVQGIPITQFCDERKLNLRERLEMFVSVCRAVQHAHHKGIIHRDLKPNNILVEWQKGQAVPKVIDFGLAKALYQQLTHLTVYTRLSQVIGTPLYMSPEQAQVTRQDIDTRSDIYSLGVVLYELLTGSLPFERSRMRDIEFDEIRQMIRDEEPSRPSHRVSTLEVHEVTTVSERRSTDARSLCASLRRELDWIVMKALEKDRTRRYESASALAEDIERYLKDERVLACPPALSYRLQKFLKRYKGQVAALGLILIAAMAGTAVSLFYARKATIAAREADQARIQAEENAVKAAAANAVSQTLLYLSDMKLASDAIANDDIRRAAELLDRHIPSDGELDRRGFEWYFFQKRIQKPPHVTVQFGDRIDDIALSPTRPHLAVPGRKGSIGIFDTESLMLIKTLHTETESVHGLAYSPDGESLASACDGGGIHIFHAASGELIKRIPAHADYAKDVIYSPDGRFLYSSGNDNLAKKWDLSRDGALAQVFTGHQREVERIDLSPDGSLLATASSDQSLGLWNTATGQELHPRIQGDGRMVCVAFSPDGRSVIAGNINGYVFVVDVKTGKHELLAKQLDGVEALTFFSNGEWLVTADRGGAVQFHRMHAETGRAANAEHVSLFQWLAHKDRAISLATTSDGQSLISGGREGAIQIWKPKQQDLRSTPDHTLVHGDFGVGPDQRIYAGRDKIHVWDLDQGREIDSFATADTPWILVACSASGKYLAAARVGELVLMEIPSRGIVKRWPLDQHVEPHRLGLSPDGTQVAFAEYSVRENVTVYDREGQAAPKQFPARQCECVAFSPDGRWLAAGHMDDLHLFDLQTNHGPIVLKGHTNTLRSAAFSPDGKWLATVSDDRLLKVWRLPDGVEAYSIVAHPGAVNSVAFSPDGRTLVTAGQGQAVKLWHVETGQPLGKLIDERTAFWKVQFTTDGQRLVGEFQDGSMVVYDASH